ncbi:hypothetical protein FH972_024215 [Carpinus fangiana]|uniref:Uncharacterized protein n=1 Tax=Carpinus fangiana TaxID=176857 RepID=A0A5N6KY40_9ROSI|nr:hypothetical protein FH972_024215 [Carpinus fangiana]
MKRRAWQGPGRGRRVGSVRERMSWKVRFLLRSLSPGFGEERWRPAGASAAVAYKYLEQGDVRCNSVTAQQQQGGDGGGLNAGALVGAAGGGGVERAGLGLADALGLVAAGGNDGGGGRAAVAKGGLEEVGDSGDILVGGAEGGGGGTDLEDEPGDLGGLEGHVLVDVGLGVVTLVGGEAVVAVLGAAEGGAEVLEQVGHQGVGPAAGLTSVGGVADELVGVGIKPVDGSGNTVLVGGGQLAGEVGGEVHGGAVDITGGEDTGNLDLGAREKNLKRNSRKRENSPDGLVLGGDGTGRSGSESKLGEVHDVGGAGRLEVYRWDE